MPAIVTANPPEDFPNAPPGSVERLWALRAATDEATAAVSALWEQINDLRSRKNEQRRIVADLEKAEREGHLFRSEQGEVDGTGRRVVTLVPDTPRLSAEQRTLNVIVERLDRAQERYESAVARQRIYAGLAEAAERYLIEHKNLTAAPPMTAPLKRGETPADALARTRAEIAARQQDKRATAQAPVTIAEAQNAARRLVDAQKWEPDLARLFAPQPPSRGWWPEWRLEGVAINVPFKVDGMAVLSWLLREQLIAKLDAEIEANAPADGLSASQRAKRLREIDAEILRLGYAEQAIIDAAAARGQILIPRPDADIRCVLWLSPDSPAPKGTSR